MKKKNYKALVDFSKLRINNRGAAFKCASGEILAYSIYSIICTEKLDTDMFDVSELYTEEAEKIPNFIKDFNTEKTIEDYDLQKNYIALDFKTIEERVKQTKRTFNKRGKSYNDYGEYSEAMTECYLMNGKNKDDNDSYVCFNLEILYDVAKVICDKEVHLYFSGRKKPVYIIGEYGTGMFLPCCSDVEKINALC